MEGIQYLGYDKKDGESEFQAVCRIAKSKKVPLAEVTDYWEKCKAERQSDRESASSTLFKFQLLEKLHG